MPLHRYSYRSARCPESFVLGVGGDTGNIVGWPMLVLIPMSLKLGQRQLQCTSKTSANCSKTA